MNRWPFTEFEWAEIDQYIVSIVNASMACDSVLRSSAVQTLNEAIDKLTSKYGEHPALIEIVADFSDKPAEQYRLYNKAFSLSYQNELPTYTLHIALAKLLLHSMKKPIMATNELEQCEREIRLLGDESDLLEWHELMDECVATDNVLCKNPDRRAAGPLDE